jgi:hypothetical protein
MSEIKENLKEIRKSCTYINHEIETGIMHREYNYGEEDDMRMVIGKCLAIMNIVDGIDEMLKFWEGQKE